MNWYAVLLYVFIEIVLFIIAIGIIKGHKEDDIPDLTWLKHLSLLNGLLCTLVLFKLI